jgi:hypothetical protein
MNYIEEPIGNRAVDEEMITKEIGNFGPSGTGHFMPPDFAEI